MIRKFSLCCGLFSLLACSDTKDVNFTAVAQAQESRVISAVKPESSIRGTCLIKPENVIKLKAQLSGEVKQVQVQQGQKVKQGATLMTIDVEQLQLRLERSKIELLKLQNRSELLQFQLIKAEKELAVVKELNPNGAKFSREMANLYEKRSELKDNEANQTLAKLDQREIETKLRKSALVAPIDGVILSRTVEPGNVVMSGVENMAGSEVLFELANPAKLEATCIVKEADAVLLSAGQTARVLVDGDKKLTLSGQVSRISPVIANQSGISRREFIVSLPDAKGLLPGMNAEVELKTVNQS